MDCSSGKFGNYQYLYSIVYCLLFIYYLLLNIPKYLFSIVYCLLFIYYLLLNIPLVFSRELVNNVGGQKIIKESNLCHKLRFLIHYYYFWKLPGIFWSPRKSPPSVLTLRYEYNHAWGRLLENRLDHVLLLKPGYKRTGCWDFGNLSKRHLPKSVLATALSPAVCSTRRARLHNHTSRSARPPIAA